MLAGWELIPEHLLDMIMEKLNSAKDAKDSLNFGAVCPEWQSSKSSRKVTSMPSPNVTISRRR